MATKTTRARNPRAPSSRKSIGPIEFLLKFDPRLFEVAGVSQLGLSPERTAIGRQLIEFADLMREFQKLGFDSEHGRFLDGVSPAVVVTIKEILRQVAVYDMSEDDLSWAESSSRATYTRLFGREPKR